MPFVFSTEDQFWHKICSEKMTVSHRNSWKKRNCCVCKQAGIYCWIGKEENRWGKEIEMVKEWGKVARGMECIVCLMTRYTARSEYSYSHPVPSTSHFTAILPCHNSFPLTMKHSAWQIQVWSTTQYTSHVSFVWNFSKQICKKHASSRPSIHPIPHVDILYDMVWLRNEWIILLSSKPREQSAWCVLVWSQGK